MVETEHAAAPGPQVRHRNRVVSACDAAGAGACTGTPPVCQPQWTARQGYPGLLTLDAVAYGNLYALADLEVGVYDLAGLAGCGGSPRTCTPLRSIRFGSTSGTSDPADMLSRGSSLTIA